MGLAYAAPQIVAVPYALEARAHEADFAQVSAVQVTAGDQLSK